MSCITLLLLLVMAYSVSASHFYGGVMTFTPKGRNPDGSFRVDFRFKETYHGCYYLYDSWYCLNGNCGSRSRSQNTEVDQSTFGNSWCQAEGFVTRDIQSNKPFELWQASCCWIRSVYGYMSWSLLTHIDLGIRSDTNEPNRSPVTTIIPLLRVAQNCPRRFNLLAHDPDGDQVKCRYGLIAGSECGGCYQHGGFHLDQNSCTLSYISSSSYGAHTFELVLEDFSTQQITLSYTDGTYSVKSPILARGKREITTTTSPDTTSSPPSPTTTVPPFWWTTTTDAPTTTSTTSSPTTTVPPFWWTTTTSPDTTSTTSSPTTTVPPFWWTTTTSPDTTSTTSSPTTTVPPFWWTTTTDAPTTTSTTSSPTTTVPPFWWTTTTSPDTTSTTSSPTTTAPPFWWTTTTPPTTTSTTSSPTTTVPPFWWTTTTSPDTTSTTSSPTTTVPPIWWTTTTSPDTTSTTSSPTTTVPPFWWTTTTPPTTTSTTSSPTTTVPPFWWTSTTDAPTTSTPPSPTTTVPPYWWTTTTQATTTTNWWQYSTTTTLPTGPSLSKIPLQFSVQVNPQVPSCTEGEYMPKFLSPTPSDGTYIQAAVNKELVIRIKAMVTYAAFNNFFISGPSNITKQTTINGTTGQSVIRWTPTTNDFGDHLPICFVAESIYSNSAYHSEMRCVIVLVGHTLGKANVVCTDTTMTVEVEKSSIIGLHENQLRLNDPSCTLTSNSTHVFGIISLNSCGTQVEEDSENIIFKNQIASFDNLTAIISRSHEVEIGFSCAYPKKGQVSFQFKAHKIPYVFTEKGFGQFTYQFEFFHSELYTRMVDPNTYPVEVNLKEMIYLKIEATTSLNNTQLFVESCKATPYDDPNYHVFYSIIENGCTVDDTIVVYPSSQTEYKFAMEAFKFIGMHDEVYISCSVILCHAGDPSTRCAQGCISPTSAPYGHHNVKRAAISETSPHYISQGPLRRKRSPFSAVTGINLNMNLVFVTGTLLVAVGLVCGVLIYKTKRTTVKYQALPSSDF